MRSSIFLFLVLSHTILVSQNLFSYEEQGLTPASINISLENKSASELYNKTLNWIKKHYKNPEKTIINKTKHEIIEFTGLKENAIISNKRYCHLKYTVKIIFKKDAYIFKPQYIQTKVNSKYDMGWEQFNLKKGTHYFKKGKPIKKTKSYVKEIPKILNQLYTSLHTHLTSQGR